MLLSCPICDDQFLDQESSASHCLSRHSYDGANGNEQDYTFYSFAFEPEELFEVKRSTDHCEIGCSIFVDTVEGEMLSFCYLFVQ